MQMGGAFRRIHRHVTKLEGTQRSHSRSRRPQVGHGVSRTTSVPRMVGRGTAASRASGNISNVFVRVAGCQLLANCPDPRCRLPALRLIAVKDFLMIRSVACALRHVLTTPSPAFGSAFLCPQGAPYSTSN